jgi:CheY-like chemotaxis protein
MKDEFLATLSHELRTPLGAILGWAQVLKRKTADPEFTQALEVIERNTRSQARLIDELLDMSRITGGKIRLDAQQILPIDVVRAAIETLTPAAEAKALRLESALDPVAGPVYGDPGRLQQAVWNLLSNAVKFTPRGGHVRVGLHRAESRVEISVADTGVGIRPEFLAHVFERFRQADASTTRRYGGLGLGLAIAKHLVELHGGTVQAESAGEGHGATFSIRLPVAALGTLPVVEVPHGVGPPVLADYLISDLSGLKVVVVDDDADTRALVGKVLSDCGAQVVWPTQLRRRLAHRPGAPGAAPDRYRDARARRLRPAPAAAPARGRGAAIRRSRSRVRARRGPHASPPRGVPPYLAKAGRAGRAGRDRGKRRRARGRAGRDTARELAAARRQAVSLPAGRQVLHDYFAGAECASALWRRPPSGAPAPGACLVLFGRSSFLTPLEACGARPCR